MKAILFIYLLTTAVHVFANNLEKQIGDTGVEGSVKSDVHSGLKEVFENHNINFVPNAKHNGKKNPKKEKVEGKEWVFLVAGSDGWSNYRHQDVTARNFINVLEGDKKAMKGIGSGRVIESTEKDTIFVNYVDHGTYGYVVFPNKDKLSALNLSEAVDRMIAKKRFDKMLLYLEACESGSMADSLYSSNSSVLVVTAAGRYESSWACFCNVEELPCLGDTFSVGWMGELHTEFLTSNKTVFDQFDYVRTSTFKSHVNIYGDYRMGEMLLDTFFGKKFKTRSNPVKIPPPSAITLDDIVDARDASLYWLKKLSKTSARSADRYSKMVEVIVEGRKLIDSVFFEIVVAIKNSEEEANKVIHGRYAIDFKTFSCYENLINIFSDRCVDIYKNAYTLQHLYKLYNLCLLEETHGQQILPKFMEAIESVCDDQTRALAEIQQVLPKLF